MSSLAAAQRRAASLRTRATALTGIRGRRATNDQMLGAGLAGGLVLLAAVAGGGADLARNTWVEIALLATAAAVLSVVILTGAPARRRGGVTLVLFAALAALTYASIAWSVQPATSWVEANRTLSYFAAFACGAMLAWLGPRRWPGVLGAVAALAAGLSGYALLVKVFPAALDHNDPLGRLHVPLDYWNATGLLAAIGLPPCLWAGTRAGPSRVLRAASVPAITILVAVLLLSYSRGALVAAVIGVGFWFAVVPLRLRGALILAIGAIGGAIVSVWALLTHAITHDHVPLQSRVTAGHAFGVVLAVVLIVMALAGLAAAFLVDRVALPDDARRRIGSVLVGLVALVPVGGVAALASSSRGFTGEVSHVWRTLTNPNGGVSDTPGRLVELANSRPHYWNEGLKVGDHALLKGVGALGFSTARTRYTSDRWHVEHAHSYLIETFADFGLIGIALSLALSVGWALASWRAIGSRAPPRHVAERTGMLTLLCVATVFAIHSLIDWTWFVPGVAVPALVCAGWLAGRGPLAEPVGATWKWRRLSSSPGLTGGLIAVLTLVLVAVWFVWQPLRSVNSDAAAITALSRGDSRAAIADAKTAANENPVAVDPLFELAGIYRAVGDQASAHRVLVEAIHLQPSNPDTWRQLGAFDLDQHQPARAVAVLNRALALDRGSVQTQQLLARARSQRSG